MTARSHRPIPAPTLDPDHRTASDSGAKLAGRIHLDLPSPPPPRPTDLVQHYNNFKRSSTPSRFLQFFNGSWLDVDRHLFDELLRGFSDGRTAVEVTLAGICYLFDFLLLLQIQIDSRAANSIAWIDADGRCFFPQSAVDQWTEGPTRRLDIEIRVRNGGLEAAVCSSDGDTRESAVLHSEASERSDESPEARLLMPGLDRRPWTGVSEIGSGDKYYGIVERLFLGEMSRFVPGVAITKMRRCLHSGSQAISRLKGFQFWSEMVKAERGSAEVKFGWYGGSAAEIQSVVSHGFGQSNSRLLGGKACGVGVHLSAPQFPYSSSLLAEEDHDGEKHLVLCRVIMGRSEEVEAGSRQFHPSSDEFDSGVDSIENPKWYIVWSTCMNTHILPECIVSFKCSKQSQGLVKTASTIKKPAPSVLSFSKLIAELEKALPSSMIKSVHTSYSQFKGGRINKDTFIRSLRTLVGDMILASSIKKIRGY